MAPGPTHTLRCESLRSCITTQDLATQNDPQTNSGSKSHHSKVQSIHSTFRCVTTAMRTASFYVDQLNLICSSTLMGLFLSNIGYMVPMLGPGCLSFHHHERSDGSTRATTSGRARHNFFNAQANIMIGEVNLYYARHVQNALSESIKVLGERHLTGVPGFNNNQRDALVNRTIAMFRPYFVHMLPQMNALHRPFLPFHPANIVNRWIRVVAPIYLITSSTLMGLFLSNIGYMVPMPRL